MGSVAALILALAAAPIGDGLGEHPLGPHGVRVSALATVTILRAETGAVGNAPERLQRLTRRQADGCTMVEFY